MQSTHGLAIPSPESNKSQMLYSLGYTVEYWIHQNEAI